MFARLSAYLKESQLEFKRVNWPTRSETTRLTFLVIGFTLGFAVFLGILDLIFNYGLLKII